ncbi:DUF6982 domain-containing protein [Cystobacter fuscus]
MGRPAGAQPEWSAQGEWASAEAQPGTGAQTEWSAPADPYAPTSTHSDWNASAEAQPAAEAQPEWATPANEPLPDQDSAHWTAPAQPEWSTDGAASQWGTPGEQAPAEWATSEPASETATPEWSAPAAEQDSTWASPMQSEWSAPATSESWGQAQESAAPVEQPPPAEPELPVMEAEPEPVRLATMDFQEIDLSDEAVEAPAVAPAPVAPPPAPVPAPRAPAPAAAPAPRSVALPTAPPPAPVTPPPAPAPLPRAQTTPPVFAIPTAPAAPAALVPGAPPPRASRQAMATVTTPPEAPAAVAPFNAFIAGEHRVIIHTVEGQVKRGAIRDVDLLDAAIPLEQQAGFAPESIAIQRVKAIFFMLATGSRPPQPEGQKIRVTFNDGRRVAGFSNDYQGTGQGFFVIPADTRTNTSRIFIYRSSVQTVAEG